MYIPKIQTDSYSCGPHSILNAAAALGKSLSLKALLRDTGCTEDAGTTVRGLIYGLRINGFTVAYRPHITLSQMRAQLRQGYVAVIHVDGDHYCTLVGVTKKGFRIADSAAWRWPFSYISNKKLAARWANWALLVKPRRP